MAPSNLKHPADYDWIYASGWEWAASSLFMVAVLLAGAVIFRFVFAERRTLFAVAYGGALSTATLLIVTNWLGYLLDIRTAMYMVPAGLVMTALTLVVVARMRRRNGSAPLKIVRGCSWRTLCILLGLVLLTAVTSFLVTWQVFLFDDLLPSHQPSALLIADGHFPVMEPGTPGLRYGYHYGSDLLAAMTQVVTGLPVLYGYDLQIAWISALLVPLGYCTVHDLLVWGGATRVRFLETAGLFGSVLIVWAAPWNWTALANDPGARRFTREFFASPMGSSRGLIERMLSVADIGHGSVTISTVQAMHNHSNGLAAPFALCGTVLVLSLLRTMPRGALIRIGGASVIVLTALALAAETIWAPVMMGCTVVALAEAIRVRSLRRALPVGIVLGATTLIARFQGGVLTGSTRPENSESMFSWNPHPGNILTFAGAYSWHDKEYLVAWVPGIALLTITIVVAYRLRAKRAIPLLVGVVFVVLACLVPPLLLVYNQSPVELIRIQYPGFVVLAASSCVIAALGWHQGWLGRTFVVICMVPIVASSVLSQTQNVLFPMGTLGTTKQIPASHHPPFQRLTPAPMAPSRDDVEDVTYLRQLPKSAILLPTDDPYGHQNMRLSGRLLQGTYTPDRQLLYENALRTLDLRLFAELGVNHLYFHAPRAATIPVPFEMLTEENGFKPIYTNGGPGDERIVFRIDPTSDGH